MFSEGRERVRWEEMDWRNLAEESLLQLQIVYLQYHGAADL